MADSWYYVQNGIRHGPVTLEQLKGMLRSGVITVDDTVWREGMAAWMPALHVPELAAEVPAGPPPVTSAMMAAAPMRGVPAPMRAAPTAFSAGLRVMMIIGAVLAIGAFFAPYFLTDAKFNIDDSLFKTMNDADRATMQQIQDAKLSTWLYGWSLWFGIVAFGLGIGALIFAILDLCLRNVPVMRIVNKWVLFVLFLGMFAASATGLTLGIFKIGLYINNPNGELKSFSDIALSNTAVKKQADDARKQIKARVDAARPEDKAEVEKQATEQIGDPALIEKAGWVPSAIPIAAPAPVVGGVLGLIAALVVLGKKT